MADLRKLNKILRDRGRSDFMDGKPIGAFYDMRLPKIHRHTESLRAAYETGWRDAWREERDSN